MKEKYRYICFPRTQGSETKATTFLTAMTSVNLSRMMLLIIVNTSTDQSCETNILAEQ